MKRASIPQVSAAGTQTLRAFEEWMRAQEDLSPASVRNYVSDVRHFIAWYEQEASGAAEDDRCVLFSPQIITTSLLRRYRAFLQQSMQRPASINRALSSIKRYIQWACPQHPLNSETSMPVLRMEEEIMHQRHLSGQEEQALLAAVTTYGTPRDRTIILLLLYTGLRANELCRLKPEQIVLGAEKGQLYVVDRGHKTRNVPLNAIVCQALANYLPTLPIRSTWVFLSEKTHEALSVRALGYIVKKYADLAGIADLSPRDLRHCFGYRLAETMSLPELARLMGHDSLETTRRYFAPSVQRASRVPAPHPPAALLPAPLLIPKLRLPRLAASLLARPNLLARMEQGRQGKLTLLLAPAGFGKTTLVRQWIDTQSSQTQTAWLSLDPEDDDPMRFWHYVLTACTFFEDKPGSSALTELALEQSFFTLPFLKTLLTSFLNELAQQTLPCLLILEDYHVITSSQIHESLTFVLDHLPPSLHLVMLSRAEPLLPLARWRARGELLELGASDLRFSPAEIAAFLQQALPAPLPVETLGSLETHLEGWPAGLRLLTLALQGKSQPEEIAQVLAAFTGSHRYVLDYFVLDVLSTQPEGRRRFLLQTSLLGRMTPSLCNAVSGREDSAQLLREVERAGLFLQALGGEPPWYRYHALFAEALQEEARQRLGEEEMKLCLERASGWYEQQGMLAEGIEAALAARIWVQAASLMERLLNVQNRSAMHEYATLLRWLELLPAQLLEAHPALCLKYATALLFTLDRSSPATLALVEGPLHMAERFYERSAEWEKLSEVLSCHAEVVRWQDDLPQAIRLAQRALQLPPAPQTRWRGASVLIVGMGELYAGRPEAARRLMLEGQELFGIPVAEYSMRGTAMLAEISLLQGELSQAEQAYRHLLATAGNPAELAVAWRGMAQLAYEKNDISAAEGHIRQMLKLGSDQLDTLGKHLVEAILICPAELLQVRLLEASGQLEQAQQNLQKLLALSQEWQSSTFYREALIQEAELNLVMGNLAALEPWQATCRQLGEDFRLIQREREALLHARFLIVRGEIPAALELLERWQGDAHAQRRIRSELEIQLLLAQAHAANRRPAEARDALFAALKLGQAQGFQRIFLEKGEALAALLRSHFQELREEPLICYARGLLAAFAGVGTALPAPSQATATLMLEPLTPQERRVLSLLAAGRSNPQIAEELVVSINTVKTQVQSVYRKLNVRSRWEAREAALSRDIL
ncbi:hypothetical protein EPA93_12825 [Ktedonosporobacter rubrisoli]|uniref:HTH luxR-type domain-containing protein n=1 Tax=Ktedonosporobacter rubrisoli TaxID=2509675 RepID=A0A4P6JNY6_KTERU|nr:tyrosine-type recombinase/integrase [Ktedonosporobacter rubrisoli]QBD76840.1 hypothetical protein EPA93_12825 [Ktedonosporobacter rubrisoli]